MNKTAIKKFALWARTRLMEDVAQRALEYGITENAMDDAKRPLTEEERGRRLQLLAEISRRGYRQVMEEAACFWFVRSAALRFMEVNGFLTQSLQEAASVPLNMQVPEGLRWMFEERSPWMVLLLPENLLQGSVAERMTSDLTEDDFREVEIIGWLYQFYLSDKHEAVVDPLHGKVIRKEDIPAATQLFTTDWVVRYILDNSLGRYWLQRHPQSPLAGKLTYLVTPENSTLKHIHEPVEAEEIKVLDPCVGAGHFLSYAFDVLLEIYRECGWSDEDAARSILENNLYGLDIDDRAVQLACFAVTMKAGKYNRNVLNSPTKLHLLAIQDSDAIENIPQDNELRELCVRFQNAKEYGSTIRVPKADYQALAQRCDPQLLPLVQQASILAGEYHIVATNPPYLNKYSPALKEYIARHFADYKGDLFSVFMYRCFGFCKEGGYCGMMTPMVWMFIKTYEALRRLILSQKSITTLIQFEYSAFEEAMVPICAFVMKNGAPTEKGYYFRLAAFPGNMDVQKKKVLEALTDRRCGWFYEADQKDFCKIPTAPIAYWLGEKMIATFENKTLGQIAQPRQGLATGCNERFLRLWHEVSDSRVCYDAHSLEAALESGKKWFPYNKGGEYRKWYGNQDYLVNWEQDGFEIRQFRDEAGRVRSRPQNTRFYFRQSISWSLISSGTVAFRYKPAGQIFDVAGMSCFSDVHLKYLLGLCNSRVASETLAVLAPTINFQAGDIANLPVIVDEKQVTGVENLVDQNIKLSKEDWDDFEISWDFQRHPLVCQKELGRARLIAHEFKHWEARCDERFRQLKENEEELNRVFIEIYGLQEELSSAVEDKSVTVRRANLQREIKSLISYAVGCIFGRYSLDREGLCYAGGRWDPSQYTAMIPVEDNILPICDDEYFGEDLLGKIIWFVEVVYGKETLEENLRFIAEALGGKGTPREVLHHYLRTGFYADHLKIYQRHPVYWLFSSGRKKGFQALIYMHRYQPDQLEQMRKDYVPAQVKYCRNRLETLEKAVACAGTSEKAKLRKKIAGLKAQLQEIGVFEEKLHRLAEQMISIDLDDGVKTNYAKFRDILAPIQ